MAEPKSYTTRLLTSAWFWIAVVMLVVGWVPFLGVMATGEDNALGCVPCGFVGMAGIPMLVFALAMPWAEALARGRSRKDRE